LGGRTCCGPQAGETEAEYRDRVLQARSQVLGLARQAGEAADAFRDRVEEAYTARDRAQELRDRVTETTKSASRAAGALGRTTADLVTTVSDNPILLGALGIVAGAVLGAILPRSAVEEEMLGEIGDRTISAARGMADAAIEQGERAARAAAKAGWGGRRPRKVRARHRMMRTPNLLLRNQVFARMAPLGPIDRLFSGEVRRDNCGSEWPKIWTTR
jgi:hypothetical protein